MIDKLKKILVGRTQKNLALTLEVTEDTLSRWLAGTRRPTSFKNVTAINMEYKRMYPEERVPERHPVDDQSPDSHERGDCND